MERARIFYHATFAALGGKPGELDARGRLIYLHDGGRLMIRRPIDGNPATVANGGTIGIGAASPEHVLAWHHAEPSIEARQSRAHLRSALMAHSWLTSATPTGINCRQGHSRIVNTTSVVGLGSI